MARRNETADVTRGLQPSTEQILARLPGPRILWIAIWRSFRGSILAEGGRDVATICLGCLLSRLADVVGGSVSAEGKPLAKIELHLRRNRWPVLHYEHRD